MNPPATRQTPAARSFDVTGPLPQGTTVLEASAGTGKTYAIASLAVRYIADRISLEQLLVVTFTRLATSELRERVRTRLREVEHAVRAGRSVSGPASDPLVAYLLDAAPDVVATRTANLQRALSSFDAATITTTHGFCYLVLHELGITGDVDRDTELVDDVDDMVAEVVDDVYVRRYHTYHQPPLAYREALNVGRAAAKHATAPLWISEANDDRSAERLTFADAVRAEVERRKRRRRLMTHDDVLVRLRDTLHDSVGGSEARRRLQERYKVVLVDEFQDTDPVQWDIMRTAFGSTGSTLILIGDPKQAIYAFRGADIRAYLDAVASGAAVHTLDTNWRSDGDLLAGLDQLFGKAQLGDPRIVYRKADATPGHAGSGLTGMGVDEPVRVRVLHREDGHVPLTNWAKLAKRAEAREYIARDLAADVVATLRSGGTILQRDPQSGAGAEGRAGRRPVTSGDIAVLVRTWSQANIVRDALAAAGVPVVLSGAGNVFQTPSATHWQQLLEALERPTSAPRVRAAALTPFLGWTVADLAATDQVESGSHTPLDDVHLTIQRWAEILRTRGVAQLFEIVLATQDLAARVLATEDGERELTDLKHVGQLLHEAVSREHFGLTGLVTWLRQQVADGAGTDEQSRRLESDADAVQVLTIHRSKGLQFPIVYVPYLWIPDSDSRDAAPLFHNPADDHTRTLDLSIGSDGKPGSDEARAQLRDDDLGEQLRLTYVALTRARHQAVLWWATSHQGGSSTLARLLFGVDESGTVADEVSDDLSEDQVIERLEALRSAHPGSLSTERVSTDIDVSWTPPDPTVGELGIRRLSRTLDMTWRRSSYSAIASAAVEATVGTEADDAVSDEPLDHGPWVDADAPRDPADRALQGAGSPLADMAGGWQVGTLVHRILEQVDFTAGDLQDQLRHQYHEQRRRWTADVGSIEAMVTGVATALNTPLGSLVGNHRLTDLPRPDRLDELWFELPLAGGDDPRGHVDVNRIGELLTTHLESVDPVRGYVERLEKHELARHLRGYLTGSLDLVMRWHHDGRTRYAVADYKTNWLAGPDEPLNLWHYRPQALVTAMHQAHYPLQALFYVVALHRYLRWRLADYDPERHIAGVLYLFLRGMGGTGAVTNDGQPTGVFSWRPPTALIVAVSDTLDRGAP